MGYAELAEHLTELAEGGGFAGELVFYGQFVMLRGEEDGVAVAVERVGYAEMLEHVVKRMHVSGEIFLETEVEAEHFTGGIIYYAVQGKYGSPSFKPVERAGVALHEQAFLGHA